jgi:signal transduction histidine kinase
MDRRRTIHVFGAQALALGTLHSLEDDLVAFLVHDLGSPLGEVIASLELASEAPSSEAQAGDLEAALRGAKGLRGVLDEALQARRQSCALAELEKAELLAEISHQLRTPLSQVIGFSELLQAETAGLSATNLEYSRYIHASGRQLLTLIDGVLDRAKVDACSTGRGWTAKGFPR